MTGEVVAGWRAGNTEELRRAMARNVVFSSPVADYQGAEAAHIVSLIAHTMERFEATHHWDDDHGDSVTAFTARVGDDPVDGVVRERRDADGALAHITLFLRPLHALEKGITRIVALRKQYPVPGEPS